MGAIEEACEDSEDVCRFVSCDLEWRELVPEKNFIWGDYGLHRLSNGRWTLTTAGYEFDAAGAGAAKLRAKYLIAYRRWVDPRE
jgi:hypothetical protein